MDGTRVESQIPNIFYKYIDKVSGDLWLKFIRLVGLHEQELQSVISRPGLSPNEQKYQALDRWRSCLGRRRDNEIDEILNKAYEETDIHRQSDAEMPPHMQRDIDVARAIYKFIDTHHGNGWSRFMHLKVPESELRRLQDCYHGNILERKYQTVLRYMRFQQIAQENIPQHLENIQPQMAGNQR